MTPEGHHDVLGAAEQRALNGHGAGVVWLTGISGAGKSTIAAAVQHRLHTRGVHTALLDGDDVRRGLSADLDFTDAGRTENIRRAAEVCALLVTAGLVVVAAFISPFAADREEARRRIRPHLFCEVFVDTPIAVAAQRDPKGLYARSRSGDLTHLTGVDSPYQAPRSPDIHIDTTVTDPSDAATMVIGFLQAHGVFAPLIGARSSSPSNDTTGQPAANRQP